MNQLQKYTWLIDTIRRAGKITHKELSAKWKNAREYSDGKALPRATFNRWRDAIVDQFGIIIDCERLGSFPYYIANPEEIDEDKLKKWMLDSFAVSSTISENISLKGRIIVDEIPSGHEILTSMLEAMKENHTVEITYRRFSTGDVHTFPIDPYCVKLSENRWYVLAHNSRYNDLRLYGLDRIESIRITDATFRIPKDFSAEDFFSTAYGVVVGYNVKPESIVIRAYKDHRHYLRSLPLHHSQELISECEEYADFRLMLAPTFDFVMKLLQFGSLIEVIRPASLRAEMKQSISDMHRLYQND